MFAIAVMLAVRLVAANLGAWFDPPVPFPTVPVAAALTPTNKVVVWSSYRADVFGNQDDNGTSYTVYAIYDVPTCSVTPLMTAYVGHDMFCPGISLLADGVVLVAGGSTSYESSFFNPMTETWSVGPRMNIPRGYNGDTTLSDGRVFTLGGSWSGNPGFPVIPLKNGEVLKYLGASKGYWSTLPGVLATSIFTDDPNPGGNTRWDNHGWFFARDDGWVFHAGPSKQMNFFSTAGNGSTVPVGYRAPQKGQVGSYTQQYGSAIMYSATDSLMQILTVGGAYSQLDVQAWNVAFLVTLTPGTAPSNVAVRQVASMTYARAFCTSTVLPDGKVLVTGGQTAPQIWTDYNAVFHPELYDPTTGNWTVLQGACCARTYHSVALLLPDATVFTGGGGFCSLAGAEECIQLASSHYDGAIFTPPNLLEADGWTKAEQPVIAAAPTVAPLGTTFFVEMGLTANKSAPVVRSFCLIRAGASTHAVNNDLRRIPLAFKQTGPLLYRLTMPKKSGTAPPGYYMLFAVNSAGVPSKAPFVQVPVSPSPGSPPPAPLAPHQMSPRSPPPAPLQMSPRSPPSIQSAPFSQGIY